MKWTRSKDGAICGVIKGIAKTLDMSVGALRLLWILSVFFFGFGLWIYFMLAIALPREDRVEQAKQPWVLGVCSKLAKRADAEVGIIRFLTILLTFLGGPATVIGYVILYFILEDKTQAPSSESRPATPPSTV